MTKKSEQSLKEMRRENDKLLEENLGLRKQLKLYHENCGLRAATVMSTLLAWLDSEQFATSRTYGVIKKLDDVIKSQYREERTHPAGSNDLTVTDTRDQYNKETIKGRKRKPPVGGKPSLEQSYSMKNSGNRSQKNRNADHNIEVWRSHPVEQAVDSSDGFESEPVGDCDSSCSDQQVPNYTSSTGHVWTKPQGGQYSMPPNTSVQSQGRTSNNFTAQTPNYSRVGPPVATSTPLTDRHSRDTATRWTIPFGTTPETGISKDKAQSVRGASIAPRPGRKQGTSQYEAIEKFLNNARPNKRLLGEIAFQLDRRILNYVFNSGDDKGKRRFYGYIVQNIPDMIKHDSVDPKTGRYDPQKAARIQYRYDFILRSLRPLGYRIETHPEVAADFVNRYGLLPVPVDQATADLFSVHNAGIIEDYLRNNAPKHEVHNLLVLLDSLALLATDDGKNLFLW